MDTGVRTITIIDDENEILLMLEKHLSREGYRVKTFDNPLNAISSIPNDTDLILLDIMMPQMNGLDALPKLQEKLPNVKVLIMTAFSTLDKVLNAHRNGANDYIMKPFPSLNELSKKIDNILND
ncbi:response regulator [Sulfurimonas lithotrophica]|uniref:Response regulator n=1 Tax=Sulfurimonas lithotrophica TaxID=2590022 RepID=A0A5P8NYD8_9BACT|nr:response regulator [Sulfurimonas lithotrophica]QFR48426.1 response regulator [Sulfurimonas lithotrophica]